MARKTKESFQDAGQEAEMTQFQSGEAQSEYGVPYRSRCGGALRTARESQGLSIQEIATRLRLSSKQIEAIEADNFAVLPEPTIVRGFIRNYAKQLKINSEPLLDAYNVIVPSAAPHELIVKPTANMKMTSSEKHKAGSYSWASLAVLLGLGIWLFYENYVAKPNPITPTASVKVVEPLPESALPAAERTGNSQTTELSLPPATASQPSAAVATNQAPAATAKVNSTTPTNSVQTTPTPTPTLALAPNIIPAAPSATQPNRANLQFSASQETWVNVVDANGKQVYSRTIFAGSRESIDVTPPVNVTVGNAGATSLSLNGKPIDLAPHSRNNVAHIKLDN
jgi:cytoskeleton protein RodZ